MVFRAYNTQCRIEDKFVACFATGCLSSLIIYVISAFQGTLRHFLNVDEKNKYRHEPRLIIRCCPVEDSNDIAEC